MLVLARRTDEKIVIGEGIVVTVLAIQGNKVRLGIEAPPEVPVHREEIAASLTSVSRQTRTCHKPSCQARHRSVAGKL